ncbi:hypothetical protein DM860_016229 [Cuscuta australis]|uniref:Uncharacterized protein n=1 Tax=Cuscuta australis TaxID=267555 RepID=A0A328E4T3_9ASTE|nr:hypothetical protein DM860_016229 [Cuscuta australis]
MGSLCIVTKKIAFLLFLCVFLADIVTLCLSSKVYVVYMGSKRGEEEQEGILKKHHYMLTSVHGGRDEEAKASHVYSYKHGFNGFAAKLTKEQAFEIAKMEGVVSVFPNAKRTLHTTHSWDFMGLNGEKETMEVTGFSTKYQDNVIIGFIDSGIWPESPSFSDGDMAPVPDRWKGHCQPGEAFNASTCNRKIIGARYYTSGYEAEEEDDEDVDKAVPAFRSARDSSGHGTHTASTAAGRHVRNASYRGSLGSGEARGGAPLSRIAVYKACWVSGCYDADLLAAFDDAIRDGVDVVSLSLGPDAPQSEYFSDAISVGSFHAASHGIAVVASAGNQGTDGSAINLAPWILTVAASSTDREFTSDILFANGVNFTGVSLSTDEMANFARIIPASKAFNGYFTPYQSSYCLESSLNRTKVRGKVLVCRHAESSTESKIAKSVVVKEAGGVGMILIDDADQDVAVPFVIPAAVVGKQTGDEILSYINRTSLPMSRILSAKTVLGTRPSPRVTAFSSKGPNSVTPAILKPDIAAPGLNILAAWSPAAANVNFNVISGTSMACPHVTGIVALIKSVHPSWSPSAIKSAIMTTASVLNKLQKPISVDPNGRRADAFDYGAGFINPTRVLNPGLVYDAQPTDYKAFLCSIGYDEKSLHLITGDNSTCDQTLPSPSSLNYPSVTVPSLNGEVWVTRTVTNVGKPVNVYKASVSPPMGVNVTVVPRRLVFDHYGQKLNFTLEFKVVGPAQGYAFGSLSWRSKENWVTSPLVVGVTGSERLGLKV